MLIGSSAVANIVRAEGVPYTRIEGHFHIPKVVPEVFLKLEETNWRALTICVCGPLGNDPFDLDGLHRRSAEVYRESKGRVAWAGTFDARGFEQPDFTSRTLAIINQCYAQGAVGVKVWKNIGMEIKSKSGEWLMPDDKALLPIYASLQKEDRTLIAHFAEPNAAWLPLDTKTAHAGFYATHPEHYMYTKPGAPTKEAILAARDRMLARYPKLRVVGCHFGSNEEDFKALAKRLDTYPNFIVDTSGRVGHLFDGDRETARQFLDKYQDRIIYGTDFGAGAFRSLEQGKSTAQEVAASLDSTHERDWALLSTSGTMTSGRREVQGLGLSEKILRKIFHDNAVRWIPGIAPRT
jgi:predicted TIM-barrel fold metal-dependent hydrolase